MLKKNNVYILTNSIGHMTSKKYGPIYINLFTWHNETSVYIQKIGKARKISQHPHLSENWISIHVQR